MSEEQTMTDTIYNGRDDLARQAHDPATLDSASVDPVLAILREALPLDTIETPIEGVKRLVHYNQQGADTIYNIVQQSGCNDMAEILDVLKTQRARIAELEAENAAYRGALEPIADAVRYDPDLMKARDNHSVYILNSDGDEYLFVETEQDELRVKHLRAAADVFNRYAKGKSDDTQD